MVLVVLVVLVVFVVDDGVVVACGPCRHLVVKLLDFCAVVVAGVFS